jgi:hypothetical protein
MRPPADTRTDVASRRVRAGRTIEDKLLFEYWTARGGRLYGEVPVGGTGGTGEWPKGCKIRRIDGVILPDLPRGSPYPTHMLEDLVRRLPESSVELVEVKKRLNRLVIGQVLAGQDMFLRQYGVRPSKLTIVCQISDPGLEWVCQERGIDVWIGKGF